MNYVAIIHKEADGDFGVSFPDFPGCVSAGKTLDETMNLAQEALEFHIIGMKDDQEIIPTPMSLDKAMQNPGFKNGFGFLVSL
jgi:predicted RNase H-like HicB family nuclease